LIKQLFVSGHHCSTERISIAYHHLLIDVCDTVPSDSYDVFICVYKWRW